MCCRNNGYFVYYKYSSIIVSIVYKSSYAIIKTDSR
jgi:hypothetical protein